MFTDRSLFLNLKLFKNGQSIECLHQVQLTLGPCLEIRSSIIFSLDVAFVISFFSKAINLLCLLCRLADFLGEEVGVFSFSSDEAILLISFDIFFFKRDSFGLGFLSSSSNYCGLWVFKQFSSPSLTIALPLSLSLSLSLFLY